MAAQNGYANIHGWQLYDTTGTTEDWSYNATGGFGYTFEIGPDEFHPPFPDVVDEYLGAGDYAGKGNREAYLVALEHAVDRDPQRRARRQGAEGRRGCGWRSTSRPRPGRARSRTASTPPSGRDGAFEWIVNPSTRPVVEPRTYRELADEPYETTTSTAPPRAGRAQRPRVRARAATSTSGAPSSTGRRPTTSTSRSTARRAASWSRSAPRATRRGRRSRSTSPAPRPGPTSCASSTTPRPAPSYTLTESFFDARTRTTRGTRESLHVHVREAGQGAPAGARVRRPWRPGAARPDGVPSQGLIPPPGGGPTPRRPAPAFRRGSLRTSRRPLACGQPTMGRRRDRQHRTARARAGGRRAAHARLPARGRPGSRRGRAARANAFTIGPQMILPERTPRPATRVSSASFSASPPRSPRCWRCS